MQNTCHNFANAQFRSYGAEIFNSVGAVVVPRFPMVHVARIRAAKNSSQPQKFDVFRF